MGKVKSWLMGMEEDAMWMSRDSWAAEHGAMNLQVYDDVWPDGRQHRVSQDRGSGA